MNTFTPASQVIGGGEASLIGMTARALGGGASTQISIQARSQPTSAPESSPAPAAVDRHVSGNGHRTPRRQNRPASGPAGGVSALDLSEHELLRAVVTGSPMALTVVDPDGIALLWNPAAELLFGWKVSEVVGSKLPVIDAGSQQEFDRIRNGTISGRPVHEVNTQRRHRDGHPIDVAISTVPMHDPDGRVIAVLGAFQDITARKATEAELVRQAHQDELTGLLNRRGFLEEVGSILKGRRRHSTALALDLDRFKVVNQALGHAIGDQVLCAFAQRLANALRPNDLVAHLEGDSFAVLMLGIAPPDVESVVTRGFDRLGDRYVVEGHEVVLRASGGVAACSRHDDPAEALRRAGVALHQAKHVSPGGFQILDEAVDSAFVERAELSAQLAGAAERGELRLHFQPIVSAASGRVRGVEALVRWEHPEHGLLGPGQFISLAEETGSISAIGRWVLQQSCDTLREWTTTEPAAARMTVSVNVSVVQLQDRELVNDVREALEQAGLAPERLHLEVTESVLSTDPESAARVMVQLRDLGVTLVIDDFGTGNSTLTALRRFPFQILKIDQSFVSGIGVRTEDSTIVAATLALAHGLGLTVVAEGVETLAQAEFLTRNRCEELQGYLLGRPVPPDVMKPLLSRRHLRRRPKPRQQVALGLAGYEDVVRAVQGPDQPSALFSLAQVLRPVLEELQERTGLESVYLTRIDWVRAQQKILAAANRGDLVVPEGLVVSLSDSVCRRSLESGRPWTASVPDTWPDSRVGREMGLMTYVSVPITLQSKAIYGTLCAASRRSVPENPEVLALMGIVARLVAALVGTQAPGAANLRRATGHRSLPATALSSPAVGRRPGGGEARQ